MLLLVIPDKVKNLYPNLLPFPVFLRSEVTKNLCHNLSIEGNKTETAASLTLLAETEEQGHCKRTYFLVIARTSAKSAAISLLLFVEVYL